MRHTGERARRYLLEKIDKYKKIFFLVINLLDEQNLPYSKFISCLYMFGAPCAQRHEVKILLYSLWYHHTFKWPSGAQSSLNLCTGRPPTGVMIPEAA